MKLLRLAFFSLFITAFCSVSILAQAKAEGKIGVINTQMFAADKGGITRYVAEQIKLNNEFRVVNQELTTLGTKINSLKKEVSDLQKSKPPVKESVIVAKAQEHDKLLRELNFKQQDAKAKIQSRSEVLLGPVTRDIYKAMGEFASQKGYIMIMDAGKLDQTGLILAFDRTYDVTDEFIKYYNARPAGTATR